MKKEEEDSIIHSGISNPPPFHSIHSIPYCYHLSFHTLPFIVLVLSLQTFQTVNSSMLFICWDNFSTSLLNFSLVITAYTWVVFMFCDQALNSRFLLGLRWRGKPRLQNEWRLICNLKSKSNGKWRWEKWTASGWEWAIFHNSANWLQKKPSRILSYFSYQTVSGQLPKPTS